MKDTLNVSIVQLGTTVFVTVEAIDYETATKAYDAIKKILGTGLKWKFEK